MVYELKCNYEKTFDYCTMECNKMPEPFVLIDEEKWRDLKYRWFNPYYAYYQVSNKEQLKQIFGPDYGGYADVYVDFNGDYAVAEIVSSRKPYVIKYAKIGCEHDLEFIEGDWFSNKYRCKKCGTIIEQQTGR